jgi:hypothetical protein
MRQRTRKDRWNQRILKRSASALWEQASHPFTRVSWGVAQVMAARKSRGQLLVLLRGRNRWYPVETVTISRPRLCPTGACDICEEAAGSPGIISSIDSGKDEQAVT